MWNPVVSDFVPLVSVTMLLGLLYATPEPSTTMVTSITLHQPKTEVEKGVEKFTTMKQELSSCREPTHASRRFRGVTGSTKRDLYRCDTCLLFTSTYTKTRLRLQWILNLGLLVINVKIF